MRNESKKKKDEKMREEALKIKRMLYFTLSYQKEF